MNPLHPAPSAATPPPDTAAYLLLDLPVAWADDQGRLLGANAAFDAATGQHANDRRGEPLAVLLGLTPPAAAALAARLSAGQPARLSAALPSAPGQPLVQLGLQPAGGLWVLTLQTLPPTQPAQPPAPGDPPDPPAADDGSERRRLADLLEMAQTLGRLGVWEREVGNQAGHWDDHVWRFWGLAPREGAPPFDVALQAVHPDDRAPLSRQFRASMQAVGSYAHRYRLLAADGELRHVRSLWQVRPGPDGAPRRVLGIVVDDTETYRLAQSFDQAQAQLNLAVALADIAIWQHDAGTGLLHTNALGWSLLGLPERPQGLPLAELAAQVHPDDLPQVQRQVLAMRHAGHPGRGSAAGGRALDAEGPVDLGARVRDADGRWRYLLTRRVARRNAQGELLGHLGVALDLTDRFDQQQHALALAQRLEMATAAAGVGIWSVALSEPVTVHWDAQMRALHGLPADEPAPRMAEYLAHHVHPADRASVADSLALLRHRREGLLDMDLRIVQPDGRVRRLASRSSISGPEGQRQLHGVMLDVTDRHVAEDRLREATERAALAARGAGIGTWESDADAAVGWWDEQMFRLRGREPLPGPLHTADMMAWLHPADREHHQRQLQAALREDAPTNTEFRVVWPDGSVRWLASRSTPVRDEGGRTVRRIGINWDITDARNAASARADRLLAQRESQAKSRFLARISHELRTPLNAVLGFSQLLLAETVHGAAPDPETWRRRVEHVQASGEHLLALIDDVLELSSLESGELPLSLQPVALAPLAATSLPLVELLAREHDVALHLGTLDGWALADPVRLRQVLLNLLSNAIKYNRRGGRVTVSAEAQDGWLLLRVADTGRGLNDEQLQHLFEPFNRLGLDREGIAGTGIGLAIVRASVQHMGGTVQVHSTPGEGSCFEVSLQLASAPQPQPPGFAPGDPLPAAPLPVGRRLLYIEDNEVNLLIVSELMRQREDLQFLSAVDGGSGLAAARAHQPVLILLDMQLPDMDGHEVLRRLRADPATAGIRCIALSANAMPEDIRRALEAGFDDYWTKPLDLKGFLRSIDGLFGAAPG